jgi:hypothetical protein
MALVKPIPPFPDPGLALCPWTPVRRGTRGKMRANIAVDLIGHRCGIMGSLRVVGETSA